MKLRHGIGILVLSVYGIVVMITAVRCYRLYSHIVVEGQLLEQIESIRKNPDYLVLEEVPAYYIETLIQIEDQRFYQHHGIDYVMLLKDMNPFKKWEHISITEQVIRSLYTNENNGIAPRIVCCLLAKTLESSYTKEEILELYINTQNFGRSCKGLAKASEVYFHKVPIDLSEEECRELLALHCSPHNRVQGMQQLEECLRQDKGLWQLFENWLYRMGAWWLEGMRI